MLVYHRFEVINQNWQLALFPIDLLLDDMVDRFTHVCGELACGIETSLHSDRWQYTCLNISSSVLQEPGIELLIGCAGYAASLQIVPAMIEVL